MGQFFKQYLEPIKLNDVQVSTLSSSRCFLVESETEFEVLYLWLATDRLDVYGFELPDGGNVDVHVFEAN